MHGAVDNGVRSLSVRVELDVWGHDFAHDWDWDWDWWAKQVAHHLPRFV